MLKDRKGYRFPVVTDDAGRTHLYNAVPLGAVGALGKLIEAGVGFVRVDVETESPAGAAAEVRRVVGALKTSLAGGEAPRIEGPSTTGHFFRGVS